MGTNADRLPSYYNRPVSRKYACCNSHDNINIIRSTDDLSLECLLRYDCEQQ